MRTPLILAAGLVMLVSGAAVAHDYTVGNLKIIHPWARATPKGASVGGGYMSITNTGSTADRLVGGSSPIAGRLEVHEMSMDNGVMRMRPVKGGLEIKPGETVELKPGSFHIMMLDLKEPIKQGEPVKGTLTFEKAGSVDVEYAVVAPGATPAVAPQSSGAHGSMDSMKDMKGMGH
jgi:copper(I)-binding protein